MRNFGNISLVPFQTRSTSRGAVASKYKGSFLTPGTKKNEVTGSFGEARLFNVADST